MTTRFNLLGFIAAVVGPAAIAVAQTPDCNGNGVPDDIDLAGKMYWADFGTDKIQRADLDGDNVEDLVTTGVLGPDGIALDPVAGKMYWTDFEGAKIQRADLDGDNVEDLVTMGLTLPEGIALDLAAGKMYWTDHGAPKIQRADLDGDNVQDLVTLGLGAPRGIALDLSAGKMYWTDFDGAAKIQRADLNGNNVEDLVTSGLDSSQFIALAVPSPDTDADGVMDECDGCPNDPTKTVPGICGCGMSDADTDGDGTPDCFDQCPDDPTSIDCPGGCGCGNGIDGIMVMPMTLLGIGWMRRRVGARRRSSCESESVCQR